VSVIVPAYNAEGTIRGTLDSVLAQTFRDLEVIVVDDGSSDATVAEASRIGDDRLEVLSCEHRGRSAARNRGIERARGDFISFIDADDLWIANKLESQLDALSRRPEAGIAYSWTAFLDPAGRYLFAKEPLYFEGDVQADLLASCFVASGSNVILRRECVQSVGLFDEALHCAEDWEYLLRAAASWPFVVVPEYQVLYRLPLDFGSIPGEEVERASVGVLERALQTAPPRLRRHRREYLSNLSHYVAFVYLTRSRARAARKAGHSLLKSIRLNPRAVLSRSTQQLLLAWLLALVLPAALARRAVIGLMRLHGRIAMLLRPSLRGAPIASRTSLG
jgi:glycosyltransferase involved in cell wall biosynthesis